MDRENQFERFFGINTSDEEVLVGVASKDQPENSTYEASEYRGLMKIFDALSITPYDTLVDFGCGMGRVLFYCNWKFMCHVTGIEYDSDVYERLLDNAEFYHVRFKEQREKFQLLNIRAEDYIVSPSDNFFYFFNPFSMEIMDEVLQKIIQSVNDNPRRITIILYYCTYTLMTAFRKYPFTLQQIIKLPAYYMDPDEKAYIYTYEV